MENEESCIKIYGYDSVTDEWYLVQVTSDGSLVVTS